MAIRRIRFQTGRAARLPGIALLLLALLLSGCSAGEAHITVHTDGSSDAALTLRFPADAAKIADIAGLTGSLNEVFKRAGFATDQMQRGGVLKWTASRRFDRNAWHVEASPEWRRYADAANAAYTSDHGFFFTTYKVEAALDPVKLMPDTAAGKLNDKLGSLSPFVRNLILSRIYIDLKLTLPLAPRSSNADAVTGGGRTLTWHVPLTETKNVRLEVTAPNVRHLLFAGIGGLAAVLLSLWVILRLRGRRPPKRSIP